MKLGIIADDFTGANDVALQLIKYGINVKSYMSLDNKNETFVYSTETRNASEEEVQNKLEEFFISTKERNYEKIYKKIDSTLRGNVKLEFEIFLKHIKPNEKISIVMPFPKVGRTVRNGRLFINDVELTKTQFAKDPYWQLKSSFLKDYFNGELVSLEEIRSGNLNEFLLSKNTSTLIFEGETNSDLELIAKSLNELNFDKNIIGSAGIMDFLLKEWGFEKEKMLFLAGSCNPLNISQIDSFVKKFSPTIYDYDPDLDDSLITQGRDDLIIFRTIRDNVKSKKNGSEINKLISKNFVNLADKLNVKKFCFSGGDMSISFMKEKDINSIEILAEIEPGIAFGIVDDYRIITKPGGFGSENIYEKVYSFLNCYR